MAVQKVLRLTVHGSLANSITFNNTFHFATDDVPVGPGYSATDLAADFANSIIHTGAGSGPWMDAVSPLVTFNNISAQSLYPNALDGGGWGLGVTVGDDNGPFGIGFAVPLPAPCAGIITWRSGLAGRARRGRTYVGGLVYQSSAFAFSPPEMIAPGARARGKLDALAGAILGRYSVVSHPNPGNWYLVVYSRTLAGATPPIDPVGLFPIQDWSVPNYWATMGSRRGGRGI